MHPLRLVVTPDARPLRHALTTLLAAFAGLFFLNGCQMIPRAEPIDPCAYMDTADNPEPLDADVAYVTPVGLRCTHHSNIIVDLVFEGPEPAVQGIGTGLQYSLFFDASRWVQIHDPQGKPVALVTYRDRGPCEILCGRRVGYCTEYLGGNRIRLIHPYGIEVKKSPHRGAYTVCLELPPDDSAAYGDVRTVTDTREHTFELIDAELVYWERHGKDAPDADEARGDDAAVDPR